jgi:hypothetical protein
MRQYQRELEADERALEDDSSDDDDDESEDHVPLHWQNYDFSRCTVNTSENVPWEYTENEVCVGAIIPSTAHLKDAVKQWSTLTLHMEFRAVKSSLRISDVCCIKDGCSFRVYAYMGKLDNYMQVKEAKGHTCTLDRCWGSLPPAVNLYRSCVELGWLAQETMRLRLVRASEK